MQSTLKEASSSFLRYFAFHSFVEIFSRRKQPNHDCSSCAHLTSLLLHDGENDKSVAHEWAKGCTECNAHNLKHALFVW